LVKATLLSDKSNDSSVDILAIIPSASWSNVLQPRLKRKVPKDKKKMRLKQNTETGGIPSRTN